jgi:RNA polymerase sigma factor (sigma-70 family)
MIRSIFTKKAVTWSDAELLEAIKRNDDMAFRYLYNTTFPLVKNYVTNNNGKEVDAEDIFQDGLLAMWDNIRFGKFELRDGTKLTSYLTRICKYRWLERLKSAGFKRSSILPEGFDSADESDNVLSGMITSEEINAMTLKFSQLGQKCQEILKLYYYEQKSMAEIAEIFDMQPNSIKNEKYRCMERLKNLFIKKDN